MFDINAPENSPASNPDVQEALSRRYSDDIIMLLPLRSGHFAVMNQARELCGFVTLFNSVRNLIESKWHPPKSAPAITKPSVNLEDLELL